MIAKESKPDEVNRYCFSGKNGNVSYLLGLASAFGTALVPLQKLLVVMERNMKHRPNVEIRDNSLPLMQLTAAC